MLDKAILDSLRTYDVGTDPKVLAPIDEAIVATHGDADARQKLESQIADVLDSEIPRMARDFCCRKLRIIGSAASVPVIAKSLSNPEDSHMARYALESIPADEAGDALRSALSSLEGDQKAGVIGSLGVRQDTASIDALGKLVADTNATVARAAAYALGAIGGSAAAKALVSAAPNQAAKGAATDASLACAEGLLKQGNKTEALAIYKGFAGTGQPKHVRLAATKGMLKCAS